jgi:CTP synthase (UTP-ammonia lyase)
MSTSEIYMRSEIKERIRKRYERERIKIEKLLTLGYTTSGSFLVFAFHNPINIKKKSPNGW